MDNTMGNPQVTDTDIAWLAGIVDGEGHIGISKSHKQRCDTWKFDFSVVNTDLALMEKVVRIIRGMGINPYIRSRIHKKETWSANIIVTVGKMAHIRIILGHVIPHLTGVKRQRAIIMQTLIESRITKNRQQYDSYEQRLVEMFRDQHVRKGTPTTTREAEEWVRSLTIL